MKVLTLWNLANGISYHKVIFWHVSRTLCLARSESVYKQHVSRLIKPLPYGGHRALAMGFLFEGRGNRGRTEASKTRFFEAFARFVRSWR